MLAELGAAISSVVATSTVIAKTNTEKALKNWQEKAKAEKDRLIAVRPKLRYPLWGIDEGLRVLTRLPDWVTHARADSDRVTRLLGQADKLRHSIDRIAFKCYRAGRTPSMTEALCVQYHAWRCRRIFNEGSHREEDAQAS